MKRLERWGKDIVGQRDPDYRLDLSLGGLAISCVELYKRKIVTGDSYEYNVLGIGGVWTATKFRKQGNATVLIERAQALARSFKLDGTVLFSLEPLVPFYQKRGYELAASAVTMHQPNGVVTNIPEQVRFLFRLENTVVFPEEGINVLGLPW